MRLHRYPEFLGLLVEIAPGPTSQNMKKRTMGPYLVILRFSVFFCSKKLTCFCREFSWCQSGYRVRIMIYQTDMANNWSRLLNLSTHLIMTRRIPNNAAKDILCGNCGLDGTSFKPLISNFRPQPRYIVIWMACCGLMQLGPMVFCDIKGFLDTIVPE